MSEEFSTYWGQVWLRDSADEQTQDGPWTQLFQDIDETIVPIQINDPAKLWTSIHKLNTNKAPGCDSGMQKNYKS